MNMHLLGRHSPYKHACLKGIHEIPFAMKKIYLVPPSVVSSPTKITKSWREIKPISFTAYLLVALYGSG